eukprot:3181037-Pleurochrysis_carterae.AAC.1
MKFYALEASCPASKYTICSRAVLHCTASCAASCFASSTTISAARSCCASCKCKKSGLEVMGGGGGGGPLYRRGASCGRVRASYVSSWGGDPAKGSSRARSRHAGTQETANGEGRERGKRARET